MGLQVVGSLFSGLCANVTVIAEESAPEVFHVTFAALAILSQLPYLQIGGGLFGGAILWKGHLYFDERDVEARAELLMWDDMSEEDKSFILDVIRKTPAAEREDVIDRTQSLARDNMWDKTYILDVMQKTPAAERGDVVDRAKPLLRDDMWDKTYILEAIRKIPAAERGDVIARAQLLMQNDMRGNDKSRILDGMRMLPAAERLPRAQRAFEQLQVDFPNEGFDINRVVQLLETPLDQPFFAIGAEMAAEALAGNVVINVHAGKRDERVKAAFLLLRQAQNMTDEEIQLASQECIKYLKKNNCDRALRVLIGPDDPNDYGPFFKEFIVNSVNMSGQEVMGRLWKFIQDLPDSDKQNALHSLVKELDNCINEENQRICDPGKAQHVFIAILQGRLKGVKIDDSIEIPQEENGESSSSESAKSGQAESSSPALLLVSVADAMTLFFEIRKHRKIDQLELLLAAANVFCDENLFVDRSPFIQEIKEYAIQSKIK